MYHHHQSSTHYNQRSSNNTNTTNTNTTNTTSNTHNKTTGSNNANAIFAHHTPYASSTNTYNTMQAGVTPGKVDMNAAQRTIHIGNLVSSISEEELITFFARCGTITNIKLAGNPSYPARFAFIEFATVQQAQTACSMSGTQLRGKPIKVAIAKNPITTPYSVNAAQAATENRGSYTQQTSNYYSAYAQQPLTTADSSQYYGNYSAYATMGATGASTGLAGYSGYAGNYATYGYDTTGMASAYTSAGVMPVANAYSSAVAATATASSGGKDPLKRTVYVAGVDREVNEQTVLNFFSQCGEITNYRFCMGQPYKFAFIEFATHEGALAAIKCTGSVLGSCTLKISFSKSAIQQTGPNKPLPLTVEQQEMVSRTVHIGNLDGHLTEEQIKQYFTGTCGPISRFVMAGGQPQDGIVARFCFIEFQSQQSAQIALSLSGTVIGVLPIKVSPSRSPILSGGLKKRILQNSSYSTPAATGDDIYGATMAANNAYQQYYGQQSSYATADYSTNTAAQQATGNYYSVNGASQGYGFHNMGGYQQYNAVSGEQTSYYETASSNTRKNQYSIDTNSKQNASSDQTRTEANTYNGSKHKSSTEKLPSPKTPPYSPPPDLYEQQRAFFQSEQEETEEQQGHESIKRKRGEDERDDLPESKRLKNQEEENQKVEEEKASDIAPVSPASSEHNSEEKKSNTN
jgi:RNA recognition motif-containing protein